MRRILEYVKLFYTGGMPGRSPRPVDPDLVQTLLRQLQEVSAATARRTRAVLDEFGLNDTAAGVLWMLDPDNPPAGMRELARRIGCDPSNVTLISDKLEAAGLTVREVHPEDGRLRVLTLTGAGLELRARLLDRLTTDTPLAGLTAAEQRRLVTLLGKLGASA